MEESKLQVLFTKIQIQERVDTLAGEISDYYMSRSEPVVAVCVLKGAFVFFADLFRKLQFQPEIDFVRLASYGNKTYREEEVSCQKDLEVSIQGKHVLVVEDIVDTGNTVDYLMEKMKAKSPKSIKVCSLLHKGERKEVDVPVDFCGFYLETGFVVGYGLDCAEKYRHLEEICALVQ